MSAPPPTGVLLVVACEAADTDELAGLLWAHGPTAVLEQDTPDGPTVVAGFPDRRAAAMATEDLDFRFTFEIVEPGDDGLDGWRPHAGPVRAGNRLVVVPAWVSYEPAPGEVAVLVDPGRAFGNGLHPTTRLALAALEPHAGPGRSVLDVGCGSGVLSVAAARLGAGPVVAVDPDPAALAAATANAALNRVPVDVRLGSVETLAGQRFDVVVANIAAPVLVELAGALAGAVAAGGRLVLAGLLTSQEADVLAALDHPPVATRLDEGEWRALVVGPFGA